MKLIRLVAICLVTLQSPQLYSGISLKKLLSSCNTENNSTNAQKPYAIVYHSAYNVSPFFGLERFIHPFDGSKYRHVATYLQKTFPEIKAFYEPKEEITESELLLVHTPEYLSSLKNAQNISHAIELPLSFLPVSFLDTKILRPMRYAVSGTLVALELALEHGYGINIGGGFHHASASEGSGFCCYGDIQLAAKTYLKTHPEGKVLIIDLDAHQGNGYAQDLGAQGYIENGQVAILDMYNEWTFPQDILAKLYITFSGALQPQTEDSAYLAKLQKLLSKANAEFKPSLIIYNAGTDVWEKDPLGQLSISKQGILQRDYLVFQYAVSNTIPIVMLTSGGYTPESASIIGASIENILRTLIIPRI